MAKIEMKGLDEYTKAISNLSLKVKAGVCGKAIYEGAKIVADRIKAGIIDLPEDSGWGTESHKLQGPLKKQKSGLYRSFGITRLRDDYGFYDVKLGFDGYNEIKTKQWPDGQPNAMVARSVERGTSFMQAHPFMKKAVSAAKQPALEAMKKSVDESLADLMND